MVDISGGNDISTAAGLTAALAAGGEFANIDATNAVAQYVFLTAASATATTFNVFFATSAVDGGGAFATVDLVGTVTATGALSTIVAANAVGA